MSKSPELIKHRVNKIEELRSLDNVSLGCEVDLRSDVHRVGHLILSHDPWGNGEPFEDWIRCYREKRMNGPLIINTKEDGLENAIIKQLELYGVSNYFFLGTSTPTIFEWTKNKTCNKFSVRLSSIEPLESILKFRGIAEWIWLDCFDAKPLPYIENLKEITGLKVCLVSPELQGGSINGIEDFTKWASVADAICTKHPDYWMQRLKK